MKVNVEHVAACRKRLSIEVPQEEVSMEWKNVLLEFQKHAAIPGFRAGRVPSLLLESRFQKEIEAEVQRKLISQSFREAVAKEKLKVVNTPSFDGVQFSRQQPLQFSATVDIAPEFQLPNYKGLKIKKGEMVVQEEEIENALKLLVDQEATFLDIKDRGLALGDFAVISYSGVCEGQSIAQISPSAKVLSENKQFWLLLARDSFLPGFCEPLLGAKMGEKRQVFVTFPENFKIKELGGRKATYFVDIIGIKEKKLPLFDDAFASKYKTANMTELREKIKENIYHDREHQVENDVRNQIVEQLLKATPFDLPESLVQDETRHVVMDVVRENRWRGIEEGALREKSKEIFDSAQQNAQSKIRASFILNRIAEAEKIQVPEKELQDRIQKLAESENLSVKELKERLEKNGQIDSLRQQILIEHTLDLLVTHAMVEAK